jgi:hypothetical protein
MVNGIDSNLLTSYFASRTGQNQAQSQASSPRAVTSPTGTNRAPSAPWERNVTPADTLVKDILSGKKFVRESSTVLDLPGASEDYKRLFTLYSGINSLRAVTARAQEVAKDRNADSLSNVSLTNNLRKRFETGLGELKDYISKADLEHVDLIQGKITDKLKSSVGVARTDTAYVGKPIHSGSAQTEVAAFQGDIRFDIAIKRLGRATPTTLSIDLNEMGQTPRSMSNVTAFINDKIRAQGLATRFEVQRTPGVDKTIQSGGRTVTISKGVDSFGFRIKGDSTETLSFTTQAKADSVFVVQTAGDTDIVKSPSFVSKKAEDAKKAEEAKAGPKLVTQLVKFQTDVTTTPEAPPPTVTAPGDTFFQEGRSVQKTLSQSIAKVHQTASGPDGSVYVLADINAPLEGQTIKGTQDVALIKYDSAGNEVFSRTLGAADTASGFSLAVSADGRVAIAGSVTGSLPTVTTTTRTITVNGLPVTTSRTTPDKGTSGTNASIADSFVTVFNANGEEVFTKRRGATAEDQAESVAFGADGSVYVSGKTRGQFLGATGAAQGGTDSYVMAFDSSGKFKFANQFGTSGTDQGSTVAVSGSSLYVASNEDGNLIVRTFDISSGQAVAIGSRNLGGLGGGKISAIDVHNGKLFIGGNTGNNALMAGGSLSRAHSGGQDGFALSIDTNLGATGSDTVAFYGGAGIEKDVKVVFDEGKAYFSGQTEGEISGTTKIGEADAYLTRVDVASGAVEWSRRYSGKDGEVNPNAIALSKGGASVLDRFGLPQGTLDYTDSTLITSATSVRAGDSFAVRDGRSGKDKKITIEANDTLESLAKKITREAGFGLKVEVLKMAGKAQSQLVISPRSPSSQYEIIKGPQGQDALEGLGITEGLVTANAGSGSGEGFNSAGQKRIGLNFNSDINLNSEDNMAKALKTLDDALKNVRNAYRYLRYGDEPKADDKKRSTGGAVPQYLNNQISNYQAALTRLTGGA